MAYSNCDFEGPCSGWENTIHDVGTSWYRHKGYTASVLTGPNSDHTFMNTSGHYLYLEASVSALQQAGYLSPRMYPNILNRQLSFWYFMFGKSIGCLTVEAVCSNEQGGLSLWRQCGNRGYFWRRAIVPLPGLDCGPFEVHFIGSVGLTFHGDIAIDDIEFNTTFASNFVCDRFSVFWYIVLCFVVKQCPTGQFLCNNGKCISGGQTCDFNDDCGDNSDETTCCKFTEFSA